eukprot:6300515-Alexandrium_andersonii.AAC.1
MTSAHRLWGAPTVQGAAVGRGKRVASGLATGLCSAAGVGCRALASARAGQVLPTTASACAPC